MSKKLIPVLALLSVATAGFLVFAIYLAFNGQAGHGSFWTRPVGILLLAATVLFAFLITLLALFRKTAQASTDSPPAAFPNPNSYESVLRNSKMLVLFLSEEMKILEMNPAAILTFETGEGEWLGKSILEVFDWDAEVVKALRACQSNGGEVDFETGFKTKKGLCLRLEGAVTQIRSGAEKRFALRATNVTERYFRDLDASFHLEASTIFQEKEDFSLCLQELLQAAKAHFGLEAIGLWQDSEGGDFHPIKDYSQLMLVESKPELEKTIPSKHGKLLQRSLSTGLSDWEVGEDGEVIAVPLVVQRSILAVLEFKPDGRTRNSRQLLQPLESFASFLGTLVTRERTAEAMRRRKVLLMQAEKIGGTGSFEWHPDRQELLCSDGLCRLLGRDPADSFHSIFQLLRLVAPEDFPALARQIRDNRTRGARTIRSQTFRIRTQAGEFIFCEMRGSSLGGGQGPSASVAGTVSDISEYHALTESLKEAVSELSRSNTELEQFAYVASHDLQEPLRKIRAFGDRLQRLYKDNADLPGGDYVERMQNAAGRMQTLIDDLLVYSRVSRNMGSKERIDLDKLLAEAWSDLELSVEEKQAVAEWDDLPAIHGIRVHIQQLFYNLLSNSIKFSKPDVAPRIRISAKLLRREELDLPEESDMEAGDFLRIDVEDNGIGFDEQYLEKIFTIFQRLHGRFQYPGTGIGLAVCKKVVENHGGFLRASSEEGKGAIFSIYFPAIMISDEK